MRCADENAELLDPAGAADDAATVLDLQLTEMAQVVARQVGPVHIVVACTLVVSTIAVVALVELERLRLLAALRALALCNTGVALAQLRQPLHRTQHSG